MKAEEKDLSELNDYRKILDEIDARIFNDIKERVGVVIKIGEYKRKNGIEVVHPEREMAILRDKMEKAKLAGLDPEFIGQIYQLMIQYSRDIQSR